MSRKRRNNTNLLKQYNKMKSTSAILWVLAGLSVLGFGIYYREIFEIVFGVFAILYGIHTYRSRNASLSSISRYERNKLSFLALAIIIFSLVNPIGNIPVIFDLFKRDRVLKGGFDEK